MPARILAVAVAVLCLLAPRFSSAQTEIKPPATPAEALSARAVDQALCPMGWAGLTGGVHCRHSGR
jgi:hypothetical protein